jgi:hypothetical protein
LVISAFQQAGIPVKTNGATYTGDMKSAFLKTNFSNVTSSIDLAKGSGLQKGDVLLSESNHTALVSAVSGSTITVVEASINEKGTATGGISGDQTGTEIRTLGYYNYPWNVVLRYNASGRYGSVMLKTNSGSGPTGVGVNADGRLENYIVGTDGRLYSRHQTAPNGDWTSWGSRGGTWKQGAFIGVGVNADGRLENYIVGTNGQLYSQHQTAPNGNWTSWESRGGSFASGAPIGVGVNADGRLENYIVGTDGRLYSRHQTAPNGDWTSWGSRGGTWKQ